MKTNGSEPTGWTGCSFCWRSSDVCFFPSFSKRKKVCQLGNLGKLILYIQSNLLRFVMTGPLKHTDETKKPEEVWL